VINYDPEHLAQWMIDVLCGVEDVSKPYRDEKISDNVWIRTFDPVVATSDEYVWHRDTKDRIVTVLDGEGWQFQFDDDIPKRINRDDVITVPKQVYHRIIIGKTPLKLKIEEVE
jgi:quercetin dioxygenase-like cupin family protein